MFGLEYLNVVKIIKVMMKIYNKFIIVYYYRYTYNTYKMNIRRRKIFYKLAGQVVGSRDLFKRL